MAQTPVVVLFGYESSTFTLKVRLALRLKQIPYTFVTVPSMMPRTILRDSFNLTYRRIPVLTIGREIYCDTAIILEALEHFFPAAEGYQTLYPPTADGRNYRSLIRGFATYWTDRPLFRVMTGLIPASVWRTDFGTDRAQLIGHRLDPDKLEKKVPSNLSALDTQLSLLEPLFAEHEGPWVFSTLTPSLADIAVYYQLSWGRDIAAGKYISNLTSGGTPDVAMEGSAGVLNAQRYPALFSWFRLMERYFANLADVEVKDPEWTTVLEKMKKAPTLGSRSVLLPTPRSSHSELDEKTGMKDGGLVAVTPDDTGRADPTIGTLVALSPEEVVIRPRALEPPAAIETRIHFPRFGFVVRPVDEAKL